MIGSGTLLGGEALDLAHVAVCVELLERRRSQRAHVPVHWPRAQGRSCRPKSQVTFVNEFASRPSMKYLLFSRSAVSNASSGDADHSRIFLPQYMRMWLCM